MDCRFLLRASAEHHIASRQMDPQNGSVLSRSASLQPAVISQSAGQLTNQPLSPANLPASQPTFRSASQTVFGWLLQVVTYSDSWRNIFQLCGGCGRLRVQRDTKEQFPVNNPGWDRAAQYSHKLQRNTNIQCNKPFHYVSTRNFSYQYSFCWIVIRVSHAGRSLKFFHCSTIILPDDRNVRVEPGWGKI